MSVVVKAPYFTTSNKACVHLSLCFCQQTHYKIISVFDFFTVRHNITWYMQSTLPGPDNEDFFHNAQTQ